MKFILAQVLGIMALVVTAYGIHFKTKDGILLRFVIANILFAIQFFLLNAITGGVISIINAIRCVVFYIYKKKELKPSIVTLLIFEIIVIISGIFSWQNMWSLIPILATVLYTYSLWQDDVRVIRISACLVYSSWAVYDLIVKAYAGVLQEVSILASSILALFKNKKK